MRGRGGREGGSSDDQGVTPKNIKNLEILQKVEGLNKFILCDIDITQCRS